MSSPSDLPGPLPSRRSGHAAPAGTPCWTGAVIPHVEYDDHHDVANAEKWAGRLAMPTYAIDDETAVKVIDGTVEVVSEGHWKLFSP